MTARERIENYRNGTQQSGGLTARERIENYRQENGLSAEPAAAETVQTAAEPVQASSAAAKAQPLHSAINAAAPGSFGGRLESSAARLRQELQPTAQRRGREQIQAELDSNAKEMQAVADGIKAMEGTLRRTQGSYGRVRDAYTADRLLQQQTEQQATLDESRRQLDELTAKRAQLERELQDAKYNEWLGLMQQPDFAEKSRYKSTENGQERKFSPVTGTYTGTGFDDIYYDYINGNQTAQDMTLLADTAQGTSHEGWRGLPENVVSLFNYIYATQGRDKAYAFLDEAAQRAYTGLEAAALSFASGTGALSLGAALGSIGGGESAKRTADVYKQLTRETQESAAQHPGLARTGSITGNIALMYGIGAGAGTIAAKAGLPYIAGRTAVGALSFGGANAIQNAGAVSTGQMSIEDYLEGVGIGLAAGGIGSAAGAFASSGVAALLEKYGLMTSFGEFIRQTAGGVTESSVNTATEYALRGEAPTKEELFETLVITFGFSLLTSATRTLETTAAQKANMEEAVRVLDEGYARLLNEAKGMTPEGVAQQAGRILNQIESTRSTLKGTYIAGQQNAVNKIYAGLDILEDVMKGYLNGYAGSSYAPGGVTGGSGGYGMTVRLAQNGAGGTQGASGTQTGTSIAAAASAAQRSAGGTQNGSDIAPATQAPAAAVSPGQQNAAPGAGAASAGGIQANSQANNSANNLANPGAGGALRESTNVNDNPAQHTEAEQRVIEEYKNSVDPGLVEFYEAAKEQSTAKKGAQPYMLKPVSDRLAGAIEQLTGVNTSGFDTRLDVRQANHIYTDHGENGKADRTMADASDVGRLQYVIDNYDSIVPWGSTAAYWQPNGRGGNKQAKTVLLSKKVNGTYYVVEAAPDTAAKSVYVVSAYMLEQGKTPPGNANKIATGEIEQPNDAEMPRRNGQTATTLDNPVANSTIPQPSPAVNTLENTRDGENGWGTRYNSAAEALEAGMRELAPSLWREYSGAEYTPQRDAIVAAVMRVGQDVGRGTVSPAKALRYLERAYKGGGIEAIERIASTPGEKYAPRAGETVTLPTAEQELAERNGGNLNGQKRTETDTGGQERTGDGNALPDRSAGRDAGERAGGKADGMEARKGGRADAGRKAIERQNRGRRLPLERVSSRELGLKQGTENPNLKLLPEDAWDDGLRQTAEHLEQETGRGVTYVLGGMEIEDADGETHTVRGVITQEQIIIQADCMSATAEQIGEHELFHYYADTNPGLISSVREEITEKYGREEFDEIVGKYIERLRGIIDASESPFADAQDAVLEDIENEIFADAYAGINAFGAHAERYQGDVRSVTERRGVTTRQTREATERKTGPPERYLYAGERAQGADLEALKRAKEMQSEGVANDVIRRETGWYTGMDGKWRFEIDDSGMEFRRNGDARLMQEPGYRRLKELTDKWGESVSGGAELTEAEEAELERLQEKYSDAVWEEKYMLTDFLKHDALFEAYPQLRGVSLAFDSLDGGTKGYFRKRDNTIVLSDLLFGKDADTLIHEIQHVIQSVEGFSPGASPEYWARREYEGGDLVTERLKEEYYTLLGSLPKAEQNKYVRYAELDMELERLMSADEGTEDYKRYEKLDAEQDALYGELYPNEWFRRLLDLNRRMKDAPGEYRSMYRNTAGEIEARDAAGRRSLTAAERRERMPDLGNENTVFAGGSGESYSIANTRNMPWKGQVRGYFSNDGTIKSSDSLYLGESGVEGVDNAPIYIPTSVITKAIRPPKGSRSAHALSQKNILNLQESIKNAPVVIDNPARNGIVYVTEDQDSAGNYIIAALDKNNDLYGENAHKVTSIHGRENIAAMLEKLGDDATIFVKNENKLNHMLPGNQILKSLALRAKVELDDSSISDRSNNVKSPRLGNVRFSVSDEDGGEKKKERAVIAQQELHRTLNTMFSIPAVTKAEMNAIVDGFAAKAVRDGSLTQDDMTALFDRLYNSGVMEVAADEYRQAARSAVEKKRIYVPEDVKHEFGDDWNGFRRQAFAAGVYLTNSETDYGIDVLNQELATSLPGIFDPDETDMRLILERVVQAAEEGKAQRMSLAEYTAMLAEQEYVSESEVLDTLERQLDWAMRTFAEKARLEIKLRERESRKVREAREQGWENSKRQRERELESRAKERAKRREIIERQRKQKELQELQQKTLKQLQWLSKNRYRAPAELQKAFDDVLSDIDIYAAGAANEARISRKYDMSWRELADMYKEAKENDKNFFPSKELEQIVARLDNRKIKDMDIDALTDLYKAAVGLRTELYNRNNVIMDELHRTFAEIYTDSKAEIKSADLDNGKTKLFNSMQLSPMNMLQRAAGWNPDSTFYSMAKQLEKGERDIRAYTVKAERMLEDFLNEHREWVERADGQGKDAIWYELEVPELLELKMGDKPIFGETFKVYMTPSQKVHMYLESKSYENLRHMAGGRTFPDKKTYSEGKRKEAFEKGRTIKLAPETVRKIVSSLTPEEMELAGVLERYYNDFAKGEINRVSNALYGYDKAVSKNYAPIYTNKSYVQSTPGVYNATAEGVGNLKAREYAKNASLNIGAFDAFEKHMEQTARFVGMAIPARNWTTLMNWQGNGTSMKDAINHKWTGGASYIEDLLAELQGNGGVQRDEISTFADKVFGNYISAVFGANPSIVLKQLGSIPLAGVWLGYKNMPSPAQLQRIDRGLIAKYTQELAWRTLGYAIPETKFLKEHPNWTQANRFTRFTFGGGAITAMDGWAASVLWPWAENKVRREHPELAAGTQEDIDSGASPFYKRVAEEFDEAVARSQSTSDIMHQGTLRRSKNDVARAFTMFKSDSSQSFNALRQRLGEAKYYKKAGDRKKYREALGGLATALLAILGGSLWAELVEFLMNLWKYKGKRYRDDNGELTADSMAGEMAIGLVGDIAGMSAGGEELAEWLANGIANGSWGLERIEVFGLEQINDFAEAVIKQGNSGLKALKGAADVVKNGGDPIEYLHRHAGDIAGGIKELAKLIATYVPALPVNNLEAYMLGTVRWVSPELAAAYEDLFKTATKDRLKGLTGGALEERVGSIFDVRSINASEGAAREAARLYEAGFTMAVPSDTPGSLSVGGEERKLEAYQKQVYDQVWAGGVGEALNELVQLDAYENAGDAEREKMFKAVYDYAADKAKAVVFEDYTPQKTTEGADAVIAAGGTAAQWGAWIGMAAGLEDSAQKYKLLKSLDYSDKVKLAIAGSIMGTEMETDGGAPSQYAKMLEAVKLGLDMNSYIELREAKAVDKFLDAANAGASIETAKNAALKLSALEPEEGKKSVSDVQKWRAAVDAGGTTEEQMNALKAVMREEQYTKLEIALSYGIEPESYVHLKELLPQYDKDGSGGISNEELEKAIDTMGGGLLPGVGQLTREQQAVLWQLFSGSKSAKNNPYSRTVGQKILDAREKGKEKDLSALMG